MDEYAGRILADRYRLPLPPDDAYELAQTRAFDTYSGQEVLVRQVPLPETFDAEMLDADGLSDGSSGGRPGRSGGGAPGAGAARGASRTPSDPAVRRAVDAAQAAAQLPDHPRLDQVFDVFAQDGSLWVVSEAVAASPLDAVLAEAPLDPYRAAEVAADLLTALRALHAHGWVHRNITARTVLICDDGRVLLTGLAAGAAEEALCGYDPLPDPQAGPGLTPAGELPEPPDDTTGTWRLPRAASPAGHLASGPPEGREAPGFPEDSAAPGFPEDSAAPGFPEGSAAPGFPEGSAAPGLPVGRTVPGLPGGAAPHGQPGAPAAPGSGSAGPAGFPPGATGSGAPPHVPGQAARPASGTHPPQGAHGADARAARAGAIAAYRAGARAAARIHDDGRPDAQRGLPAAGRDAAPGPPGRIADPYGVRRPARPLPPAGSEQDPSAHQDPPHQDPPGPDHAPGPHDSRGVTGPDPRGPAGPDSRGPGAPQVTGPGGRPVYGPGGRRVYGPEDRPLSGPVAPGGRPAPGTGPQQGSGTGPRPAPGGRGLPVPSGASVPAVPEPGNGAAPAPVSWGEVASWGDGRGRPAHRGPGTPLAAERARQARMTVVGAVTERWAPEQAGPVHENWQLSPPVGPATDLWALGALLFRAVQGHAPYPEESTAELVEMVCSEPPAFAEECGPLRPVVESLLRQDPTERPDFEELRGWLRSLIRSAPEPDAGSSVPVAPTPPADPAVMEKLPIVRRRGELVRRRRGALATTKGRHKRGRERRPRQLGRTLVVAVLLLLVAGVAYAVLFLPEADDRAAGGGGTPTGGPSPSGSSDTGTGTAGEDGGGSGSGGSGGATHSALPDGFALESDPEGFRIAVPDGFQRQGRNARSQIVYSKDGFQLIVVPGRDTAKAEGSDPMVYQREKEHELQPFRDSSWATSSGMRTTEVGDRIMAEGEFTWQNASGGEIYVRNLALLDAGRYHVVQVRGPRAQRDRVDEIYEQAAATYQHTD